MGGNRKEFAELCWSAIGKVFEEKGIAAKESGSRFDRRTFCVSVRLAKATDRKRAIDCADDIALASGESDKVDAKRRGHDIQYRFVLPKEHWEPLLYSEIMPALGVDADGEPFSFNMADHSAVIVAGLPGSGKSNAMMSIMHAATMASPPQRLRISLVDPHSSLIIPNRAYLQHPVATNEDKVVAIVDFFKRLLYERSDESVGERVVHANPDKYPYHLLVVDEAVSDLVQETGMLELMKHVVAEGRKFKIGIMLGIQKSSEGALPGINDLIRHRFVGYCTSARLSSQLAGRTGVGAENLSGSGDFFYVSDAGIERVLFGYFDIGESQRVHGAATVPFFDVIAVSEEICRISKGLPVGDSDESKIALDILSYVSLEMLLEGSR